MVRVSERRGRDVLTGASALEALGIEVMAGGHRREHLDGATLVVASPGVPEHAPVLGWAAERGLPIWSELELGSRLCAVPYVAITGTNGKSTTTEMVARIMSAAGLDAVACGNIGYPFSLAAREGHDALAVEASSFQLRFHHTFHPKVSVLLNLAPDHLDWHGSFEEYAAAKARIYELQAEGDTHVGNRDDPTAAAVSERAPCRVVWFGSEEAPRDLGEGFLGRLREMKDPGTARMWSNRGFLFDAAAAAAAAAAFGVTAEVAAEGLSSMEPLPHRDALIATVGGVSFVDDSKATNPHAALAALEGRRGVVLIAGGLSKGVDLSPLKLAADRLRGVVAIGEAAQEVVSIFSPEIPVRRAGSMDDAVREGFALADGRGDVLLAPACASQDMFIDYRDRGERFAAAVAELAKEVAGRGE